ncbi:type II secretion system pilot lipoprotein GspS-beta [Vibrio owensii]|uniref:type II secretion system pilot lipoprotein GspS-beta n=1 Tax=Vibrio owensii TaxID=696485 RepID=UPI0018F233D7|nr:type II secretion system pilot lipoprotein GspS-beta [Vibrio owensii]
MARIQVISLLLLGATIQGCTAQSHYHQAITNQLAQNRSSLLIHDTQSLTGLNIIDSEVKDDTIQLTVQMPTLTESQAKTLPTSIAQAYCTQSDTLRLLNSGVRYHLSVLNQQLVPLTSFYVDSSQCP